MASNLRNHRQLFAPVPLGPRYFQNKSIGSQTSSVTDVNGAEFGDKLKNWRSSTTTDIFSVLPTHSFSCSDDKTISKVWEESATPILLTSHVSASYNNNNNSTLSILPQFFSQHLRRTEFYRNQIRHFSTHPVLLQVRKQESSSQRSIVEQLEDEREKKAVTTTKIEKVEQAGKDVTYITIILIGISVTMYVVWIVARELFAPSSPNRIYSKALKMVKQNQQVIDVFGEPMKGYGEETRRGRRRHVSHVAYEKDGRPHVRLIFHLQGPLAKGTVHAEMKEDEYGKWDYRYLFVQSETDNPPKVIVLIDNR